MNARLSAVPGLTPQGDVIMICRAERISVTLVLAANVARFRCETCYADVWSGRTQCKLN